MSNGSSTFKRFGSIRISLKLYMIVGLTVIGIVALGFVASSDARKDLEAAKRNELRHLVETTISTIKAYHARAEAGALTDQQAQRDAMRAISDLRYQGKQYFWINDMHPRMLMHPIKPALDGKDLSSFKDPRGKPLFVEFVNVVKKKWGWIRRLYVAKTRSG